MSIKLKLTILFLAVALIPTLLVVAISFQNYRNSLENTHLAALQHLTSYKAETIETYFAGLKDNIKVAQTFYNIKKNLPLLTQFAHDPNNPEFIAAKNMLDEQLPQTERILALHDIMLVNPDGLIIYSTNSEDWPRDFLKPLSDPDQKAFAEGRKGVYFSDIFAWEEKGHRPEMLVTAPVTDFNDAFIGVMAFEIDMAPIYKLIQDTTGLGRTGETLVGRKTDTHVEFLNPLRHDPEAALRRKVAFGDPFAYPIQQAVQGKTGSGISVDYRGKKVIAAWRYIPSLDWGLVAKIDVDEAFADVTNLQKLVAIVLFLILILAGLMAFSIARSIAEPVRKLAEGAMIIGSGDLDFKVSTNARDEIGQLSRSFDKMTHDLKTTTASRDELNKEVARRMRTEEELHTSHTYLETQNVELREAQDALRESERFIKSIAEASPHWFYVFDFDSMGLSYANRPILRDLGYTADVQTVDVLDAFRAFMPAEEMPHLARLLEEWRTLPDGRIRDDEYCLRHADGTLRYFAGREIVFARRPDGTVRQVLGLLLDITDRKRAEQALKESQMDLARAQAVALVGSWRMNVQKNELTWSDEAYRIFAVPKGTALTYESFLATVHPDDRSYVDQKWNAALVGEPYNIEHRIVVDGQVKWVREKAELEFDKDDNLLGGFGTVQDITARKQAEEALRKAQDELELRVKERTAELAHTVETLEEEVRQRLRAEQLIKAERKRFENVLEMMPAYAVLLTPDYHVAFANRTFREWFGDDKGRKCHEFLFNKKKPCEGCETYTVLKTGKNHFWEWTGPNGRNYDIYDYPFTDTDGSPLIMEIGLDVTAHKQAQKAVQTSEDRYRSLTVATTQVVWTTTPDGQVVGDLPSWREFTGQTINEIQGWGWINSLHPDDRDRTAAIWSEAIRTSSIYQIEYRIRSRDGEYRHVATRGVPVLEEDGCTIREWIGTCTDITERKMAQQRQAVTNALLELFARKESRKEYLDSTVEAIHQWSDCEFAGIRIKDKDGNIPYEAHVGFDKDFLELENHLNLGRDHCVCIRSILQEPQQQEKSFMTDNGSFYCNNSLAFLDSLTEQQKKEYRATCVKKGFLSIAVVPIRYHDEIYGAIHLADFKKDMLLLPKIQFIESTIAPLIGEAVQRFNVEAELEKYRLHLEELVAKRTQELEKEMINRKLIAEDLARSNKDLEQFAYVASHDLQEPLRAVAGFVELLKMKLEKTLDSKSTEYMTHTVEGVKRMQSLINGLLEYSRIGTRGKKPEPVDSKTALDRALAHLHMSISESGAKITAGQQLPHVNVDSFQLAQLFQNLISNAIKFRSEKTPEINITAGRKDGFWQFAVVDNGIGIEPQYADRIFLLFQRLHSRVKYPGTGIGLAICKKIVERHGGKIWVESKAGAGSTFYFTIPDTGESSQ